MGNCETQRNIDSLLQALSLRLIYRCEFMQPFARQRSVVAGEANLMVLHSFLGTEVLFGVRGKERSKYFKL